MVKWWKSRATWASYICERLSAAAAAFAAVVGVGGPRDQKKGCAIAGGQFLSTAGLVAKLSCTCTTW